MMRSYTLPPTWDAIKFASRYDLNRDTDFYVGGDGALVVIPDFKITDDPPIFDPPDPFVPVPGGVKVHHWPELAGWIGNKKIIAQENGAPHHECYYVIADNAVALNNLAAMPYVNFAVGQPAYLKDKLALVTWEGTKWK